MSALTQPLCPTPPRLATPNVGDVVSGKYRLVRSLAEGGMGVVFEAEHLRLRQRVAIKFPRHDPHAVIDPVERFEREARASGRMRGPHVVQVLDVDTDENGRPYIVMELLRGRDLEAELRARGSLPIAEAVDWVLQACSAVAKAHAAGIVHRDLKPSNLFLAEEAGVRVVKVLDFGISMASREEEQVTIGSEVTVGTPLYMSPEQVRSPTDVDHRADIWSLGVILYELIAGAPPFKGTTTSAIAAIVADATPSLREVRHDVPQELERALITALAKAPDDRFPNAEAFGAALIPFASEDGITGPFSLRPSQYAFETAWSAMARAPSGPRASDASDLLKLPPADRIHRKRRAGAADAAPSELAILIRTFVSAMAIGVGIATAVTVAVPPTARQPAPSIAASRRADGREGSLADRVTGAAPGKRAALAGVIGAMRAFRAMPPEPVGEPGLDARACPGAFSTVDCLSPGGPSHSGPRSMRFPSQP